MGVYIEPIGKLINEFTKLPGVGGKTAQRYAYKIISMSNEDAKAFADSIMAVKNNVHYCRVCGNYTDGDICEICKERDGGVICVVKEPKDVVALEKLHEYHGVYHVLHGLIAPLDGITPDKLKIKELVERIGKGGISEVIMATNPTAEGDATAIYISRLIKPLGVKVTRLAFGLPIGGSLEYADEVTLYKALENRNEI